MASVDCTQFSEIDALDFDEAPNQSFLERAVTGTDHCRLGPGCGSAAIAPKIIGGHALAL